MKEEPKVDPSERITTTHQINEISPSPLLREVGPEKIEKFLDDLDYEYEKVKDEYQEMRHHEYIWKLEEQYIMLTTDGLMATGNTIGFSHNIPRSLEWDLIKKICRYVLKTKGVELQQGFEAETIMDMDIRTPEGFLVNQLDEDKRKTYIERKSDLYGDLCDRLDGINSIEKLKEEMETYYEQEAELSEEYF